MLKTDDKEVYLEFPEIETKRTKDTSFNKKSLKETLSLKELKKRIRDSFNTELPQCIERKIMKQYIFAAISLLFIVLCSIYYAKAIYLTGLIIPLSLVFLSFSIRISFNEEKIAEMAVICSTVMTIKIRNKTRVVFMTNDDVPQYYEFIVPGKYNKKNSDFIQNHPYVIYFDKRNPKELIAYTPL